MIKIQSMSHCWLG